MSRGIVVLAQNSEHDYVLQACLLAMSLKISKNNTPISIVTNNEVPTEYKNLFDKIIEIPWGDLSNRSICKIENRWKIFYATPYKETIVLDTDMLVLDNIDYLWDFYKNYDIFFTTNVKNYRGEIITSDFYRKTFVDNNLPNVYTSLHYFKKSELAHNVYAYFELVVKNWNYFYFQLNEQTRPGQLSIDVAAAITIKMMNCVEQMTNKRSLSSTFTHLKPKIQGWDTVGDSWQSKVSSVISDDGTVKIGNHKQNGILHYTEKDFVYNTDIIEKFRKILNV